METVKKSGSLSEISCPRLLAQLHRNRFDGTLRLSRGALLKLLYFQGGEIAMASSNDQADHLAPILIRAGKLKAEQMDLARKSTRPGVSLARVLVQMGFLTSGELFAGARQQLRQIVGSVLPLTDAGYEIQGGFFPREITSLNVDTRELLLDLIRDLTDRSFVLLEVGAPDTVYVPAGGGNGADTAPLPRRWKELVERFGQPMAIRDFGQAAGLDDFSASKIVYGLSLLGRLSPEHPPAEETPEAPAVADSDDAGPMRAAEEPPSEPEGSEVSSMAEPIRVVSIHGDIERAEAPMGDVADSREPSESDPWAPPAAPPAASSIPEVPAESVLSTARPATQEEPSAASTGLAEDETVPPREATSSLKPIREEVPILRTAHLPRSEPSRPWTILSILSGVALLALVSYWFVFLRTPAGAADTAGANESASPREAAPVEASPPDVGTAPSETPPEATGQGEAPPSDATDAAHSTPTPGSGARTPGSTAGETSSVTPSETAAPHPTTSDASSPLAAAPPAASPGVEAPRAGPVASAAWAKARAQLDAGEHAAAARSFSQALRPQAASFTLQIAIACQEESLRKAARGTHPDDPFFVTPFLLQGRSCFRLCFGVYPSIDQAERAAAAIPPVLAEGGTRPVVMALRRITATEGH
jgi:DedD protein